MLSYILYTTKPYSAFRLLVFKPISIANFKYRIDQRERNRRMKKMKHGMKVLWVILSISEIYVFRKVLEPV